MNRGFSQVLSLAIIAFLAVGVIAGGYALQQNTNYQSSAKDTNLATDSSVYPTFAFKGAGFAKNENVSRWYQTSDGKVTALPAVRANKKGQVSFTLQAQASWPYGNVRIVAHGQVKNNEVFMDFNYQGMVSTGLKCPGPDCSKCNDNGKEWADSSGCTNWCQANNQCSNTGQSECTHCIGLSN